MLLPSSKLDCTVIERLYCGIYVDCMTSGKTSMKSIIIFEPNNTLENILFKLRETYAKCVG